MLDKLGAPIVQATLLAGVEAAVVHLPNAPVGEAPLQTAELLQLDDAVVVRIAADEATNSVANYFITDVRTSNSRMSDASRACRTFPGHLAWPIKLVWDVFDALLGGALIPTVPIASSCYDTKWGKKDTAECANVVGIFTNPLFHESDPTSIMRLVFQGRTCMPSNSTSDKQCTKAAYPEYAVKVTNVAQIQLAVNFVRAANLRLVIKNTGHCYLGKSSGAGALSLWMQNMNDINYLPNYEGPDYSGPALKLAAGVTVREVYKAADKHDITVTGAVSWVSGSPYLFNRYAN